MLRKLVVTAPRKVEIHVNPETPLQPGMVTVKPAFFGISVGTELNTYRGGVNWHSGRDEFGLFQKDNQGGEWKYPADLGYANVGTVIELSPDVTQLRLGQVVFSTFGHQTPLSAPWESFLPVPENVDPRKYLFFQLVRTGLNAVHHARPVLGDTLAIFGLGAVGLIILQLAKRAGAQKIIAFDLLPKRRELAKCFGADVVADPSQTDPAYVVRENNSGRGADVAIEAAASYRAIQDATRAVDRRGRVIMASMPNIPATFHFGHEVHFNAISITGANVMQTPHDLGPQWNLDRQSELSKALIPQLDLIPLITKEYPFENASEAYAMLDQNPSEVISIVLRS